MKAAPPPVGWWIVVCPSEARFDRKHPPRGPHLGQAEALRRLERWRILERLHGRRWRQEAWVVGPFFGQSSARLALRLSSEEILEDPAYETAVGAMALIHTENALRLAERNRRERRYRPVLWTA